MRSIKAYQCRSASKEDLDELVLLEKECFASPWNRAQLEACFSKHYRIELVLHKDTIIAFAIVQIVAEEAELQRICTKPNLQRQGIAGRLLKHVIKICQQQSCKTIFLEFAISNKAAQELYKNNGFVVYGRRKNYYALANKPKEKEDATLMKTKLD
jgi:[ribosomal protein S18]-alanine N-acetyltransferase